MSKFLIVTDASIIGGNISNITQLTDQHPES